MITLDYFTYSNHTLFLLEYIFTLIKTSFLHAMLMQNLYKNHQWTGRNLIHFHGLPVIVASLIKESFRAKLWQQAHAHGIHWYYNRFICQHTAWVEGPWILNYSAAWYQYSAGLGKVLQRHMPGISIQHRKLLGFFLFLFFFFQKPGFRNPGINR